MGLPTDRWLEMDLTWFDPVSDLVPQIETLLTRIAPLLHSVEGERGIFFNVGWLIDLVTEWTGQPDQLIPTKSRRTAPWAARSYVDLAEFIRQLRTQAAQHDLPDLKIGVLFVGWAHVVWPPELKIYDFDSDWYRRHPELYGEAHTIIGMPELMPINRLHEDNYPYAAFPTGLTEGAYFPDFFGPQWGHLSRFLGLDALLLRDGMTGPMVYTRNGPYGTCAPANPRLVAEFSQSVRDLYKAVKTTNPDALVFGYSSAISPVADWRVGCVDFEALVADGFIDGWIEQTWGGAWQDWWHQLWKGWTFQLANLLTRGAMIARANERRERPCKFYNLIETWDGWEPWDTIHQVPHKLRWAIWAFSHAGTLTPNGIKVPDGSYISWMNNGAMELLSEADVEYIRANLDAAQASAVQIEQVYGPSIVYNRRMMEWLSQHHPDWNISEWVDDQSAMLMKWGIPILSATRADWLASLETQPDAFIFQTPGQLDEREQAALSGFSGPVLAAGRADMLDESVRKRLGIQRNGNLITGGFHVARGVVSDAPSHDRPYIRQHQPITVAGNVHYQTAKTPLITSQDKWIYWQPPDWSEPFNQFVPKYQLGSTFPHYLVATLLHEILCNTGLSYAASVERPYPIALHLWRSGGRVHVLVGNLETGEFGDSRTPRTSHLRLSRSQLGLSGEKHRLIRVDVKDESAIALRASDETWLSFTIELAPEQAAVYVVQSG
jgi:hypothetical protein